MHISKIHEFLLSENLKHSIYTIDDNPLDSDFDLGISYCYPRKISNTLLATPKNGFVNYHPGPLPKYKGPNEYEDAIKNKEVNWGVTVHYMTEEYDSGEIILVKEFNLQQPPTVISELAAMSHNFLFELFKETVCDIYNGKIKPR